MSLRGFWNKDGPTLVRRTQFNGSQLRARPQPLAVSEGSWRDHPDREAAARAERALCTLPKVSHRDS